jgi:glutaredoxin
MQSQQKIELFHRMSCPFSAKVRDFIATHHLKPLVVFHDIEKEPRAFKTLKRLSKGEQVPCLVIDDKPLLESEAIIHWLAENLVKPDQFDGAKKVDKTSPRSL